MMKELEGFFEPKVDIPLIRHGLRQRIETLINEEALLLARYLRDEKKTWIPRFVCFYTINKARASLILGGHVPRPHFNF